MVRSGIIPPQELTFHLECTLKILHVWLLNVRSLSQGAAMPMGPVRIMTQHCSPSQWAHVLFQNLPQAFQVAVETYPGMQAKAYLSFTDYMFQHFLRLRKWETGNSLKEWSIALGIPSELHLQLRWLFMSNQHWIANTLLCLLPNSGLDQTWAGVWGHLGECLLHSARDIS